MLVVGNRPTSMFHRSQFTPTLLGEDLTMLYRPLFWTSYWMED
jgi:hypothetical protein